ncbi:MAG: flagellar hook-associated protein 3 [Spirochaetota bacterium]|nr:flagellar hook-associated protein 3 [Spirochaetota bacterium]
MLGRVTPGFMQNDFLKNIQTKNENFQKIQTQLTTGMKVNLPSDDPANVINYMKWESKTQDLKKFNQIIGSYKDKMNMVDGHLESMSSGLHRARELVVQAANGVYTKDERVAIAVEIDQIVRQLVSDANSEYQGNAIFSGTSARTQPYRLTESFTEDTNMNLVSGVEYFGNAQEQVMDIGKNDRIVSVLPGTSIFETTATVLESSNDSTGYIVAQDSAIMIEGVEIPVMTGDNIEVIAQKINQQNLSVNASIETNADGESHFRLTSVSARQPWLQDVAGSTVLQDLGIINNGTEGPKNYSTEAVVQKKSIFDTLLTIKDNLLQDDILKLGGEDLGFLDQSLNNIIRYRTYTGAVTERLEQTYARNETEAMYLKNSSTNAVNIDFTKSVTELKMAEFAHQTALNIGAKLMPTTLMDFLR